jgi:hypothetical protein
MGKCSWCTNRSLLLQDPSPVNTLLYVSDLIIRHRQLAHFTLTSHPDKIITLHSLKGSITQTTSLHTHDGIHQQNIFSVNKVHTSIVHSQWPAIAYLTPGCLLSIAPVHHLYLLLHLWARYHCEWTVDKWIDMSFLTSFLLFQNCGKIKWNKYIYYEITWTTCQ